MASVDYRDYVLNIETLEARLKHRRPGRTPAILKHLDIGTFPHISPASTQEVPQRPPDEKFHFLKWVHRSNNSDLAVVKLQNDPVMKILKIVIPLITPIETAANHNIAQKREYFPC